MKILHVLMVKDACDNWIPLTSSFNASIVKSRRVIELANYNKNQIKTTKIKCVEDNDIALYKCKVHYNVLTKGGIELTSVYIGVDICHCLENAETLCDGYFRFRHNISESNMTAYITAKTSDNAFDKLMDMFHSSLYKFVCNELNRKKTCVV